MIHGMQGIFADLDFAQGYAICFALAHPALNAASEVNPKFVLGTSCEKDGPLDH
jgi:hypothetical protein